MVFFSVIATPFQFNEKSVLKAFIDASLVFFYLNMKLVFKVKATCIRPLEAEQFRIDFLLV